MLRRPECLLGGLALSLGLLTSAATAPAQSMNTNHMEVATIGGGCFWCMEAVFQRIPGVKAVTCGFAGGHTPNPTYEQVCTDTTGYAEVIQIDFDPQVLSYKKLLGYFWEVHDPTTLNRQGPDAGTQYRSIILYNSSQQKEIAEQSRAEAQKNLQQPIVTEIVPLKRFYPAAAYHQNYFNKNPNQGYCRLVIRPKVEKLEQELRQEAH